MGRGKQKTKPLQNFTVENLSEQFLLFCLPLSFPMTKFYPESKIPSERSPWFPPEWSYAGDFCCLGSFYSFSLSWTLYWHFEQLIFIALSWSLLEHIHIWVYKEGSSKQILLLHIDANSHSPTALGTSPKAHAGHAVLLTYRKRGVFPPLSLEWPCCEVLRLIPGVSVPQTSLFQSSPGEIICRELLLKTNDFNCPGAGPCPPSISPKSQLSILNSLSQEQPHSSLCSSSPLKMGITGGWSPWYMPFQLLYFFPAKTVFIILNLNSFHEGIPSTSLFGHWRRKSWFILPSINNCLSVRKKEWDYWHMLLDIF